MELAGYRDYIRRVKNDFTFAELLNLINGAKIWDVQAARSQ